jgi:nicotinate-nucleotide--dimethylbenzimidazole phosphoribosyltransferase
VEAELMEEAEEPAADEAVEESMPAVGEAAQAEQEQAETESELYREDEAGADAAAGAAALPTPTPAPLSTLEQPALAEEVRPSDDQRAEPAAEEESLAAAPAPTAEVRGDSLAEGAPPPAPAEATEAKNLAQEDIAPRLVEIRDQSLSIRPGLIRLEGVIEVEPETVLQATLLRNGAPLESWAASAVVQTVVQAGGQFAFEFEAATDSAEQDLFAVEPANYQIVISSVGVDEPVTATVFFDTFGPAPAATAEPPTATSSPPATPTAVAKVELTSEPSPSPSPVVTPMEVPVLTTPTVAPTQTGPIRSLTLIVMAVLLGFGALVVVGLLLWWLLKKQPR